jgi:hypothetical protein
VAHAERAHAGQRVLDARRQRLGLAVTDAGDLDEGASASANRKCGSASSSSAVRSTGMTTPACTPASSSSADCHLATAAATALPSSGTPSSRCAATLSLGYGLSGMTQRSSAVR